VTESTVKPGLDCLRSLVRSPDDRRRPEPRRPGSGSPEGRARRRPRGPAGDWSARKACA